MFALYIITVLLSIIWGLWFLYYPGSSVFQLGLKIKYILFVFILSLIPFVNLGVVFVSFIFLFFVICSEGWSEVFPGSKIDVNKFSNFFNYEFFKKTNT